MPRPAAGAADTDETSELRRVCHEYYLVQQELQRAESDQTNAEQVVVSLTSTLEQKRSEARSLRLKNEELQRHIASARANRRAAAVSVGKAPHSSPSKQQQQQREAAASLAGEEVLLNVKSECENLVNRTRESVESLDLIERSLQAQVRFNTVLATEETRTVEKQMLIQQRIDSYRARLKGLDHTISQEQQRLRRLRQDAAARRASLERIEAAARERDGEAVRQKKDASLARRIYLGEVEHAREQTAWLEELMIENSKLRILFERLGGLPGRSSGEGDDAGEDRSDVSSEGDDGRGPSGAGRRRRRRNIVAQFQQHNLLLLQQLVNSMQLLESELTPPLSHHPSTTNHN